MSPEQVPPLSPHARVAPRLLLVEDEASLVITLTDRLVAEGYVVEVGGDGESGLELLREKPFDLLILDLMLPGMDGFEVCRELRRRGLQLPVLMLTARSQVVDKVVGFKLGADDYLTKPFEMAELLARVEAVLRRRSSGSPAPDVHLLGDVRVDFRRTEVTRGGEPVPLSSMEFRLLRCFVEHRGEVLSRERLLDEVWGYETTPFSHTIDVHGAGAQRSDPKSGSVSSYYLSTACSGGSAHGHGPQGDVIRIGNFVRLVRGGDGPLAASFAFASADPAELTPVTFTAVASGALSPYSYTWDLGGIGADGEVVTRAFAAGTYTVTLTVTDAAGFAATATQSLTVDDSGVIFADGLETGATSAWSATTGGG